MSRVCHLSAVFQLRLRLRIGKSDHPVDTCSTPRHLQTNFPSQVSLHLAQRIQQTSPPEQCRRSWLARSVNHFVLVGEAVETCSRALCVSSHVPEEEPVADVQ